MLNEPLAEKIALSALAHAALAPLAAQCRAAVRTGRLADGLRR
jgi:hypothetical protein